jgi:hypothetical protein
MLRRTKLDDYYDSLFKPLGSRETAIEVVIGGYGIYVLIVIIEAVSLFLGTASKAGILIDLFVVGACGFFLINQHSRIASIILLLQVAVTVLIASALIKSEASVGFLWTLGQLVKLWAAIRMVEGTFKLHGRFSIVSATKSPPNT